jgi:hypothetical protein
VDQNQRLRLAMRVLGVCSAILAAAVLAELTVLAWRSGISWPVALVAWPAAAALGIGYWLGYGAAKVRL